MPPGRAGSAKLGGSQADAPGGGPGRAPPAPAVPPGRARGHKAALWAQISHSSLSLFFFNRLDWKDQPAGRVCSKPWGDPALHTPV